MIATPEQYAQMLRPGQGRGIRLPGGQRDLDPDPQRRAGFTEADSDGIVQVSSAGPKRYFSGASMETP